MRDLCYEPCCSDDYDYLDDFEYDPGVRRNVYFNRGPALAPVVRSNDEFARTIRTKSAVTLAKMALLGPTGDVVHTIHLNEPPTLLPGDSITFDINLKVA